MLQGQMGLELHPVRVAVLVAGVLVSVFTVQVLVAVVVFYPDQVARGRVAVVTGGQPVLLAATVIAQVVAAVLAGAQEVVMGITQGQPVMVVLVVMPLILMVIAIR